MKLLTFPVVSISLLLFLLVGSALYWCATQGQSNSLDAIPMPDVTLVTSGLVKPEQLSSSDKGTLLNPYSLIVPTGSFIQVDATYRYEVSLRHTWSMVFDTKRKVAFVIIPIIKARLPVEFEIRQDETVIGGVHIDSKWFWKFEDAEQIKKREAILAALNTLLTEKAKSTDYIDLRKEEARQIVEAYISEWLIKQGRCTAKDHPIVKVYFENEKELRLPIPQGKSLVDFKP